MDERAELEALRRLQELEARANIPAAPEVNPVREAAQNVPGFLAESGRKALASGIQSAGNLASGLTPMGIVKNALGMFGVPQDSLSKLVGGKIREKAGQVADAVDVPDVPNGPLWDKAVRGMGSAMSFPIPGAGVPGYLSQALSGGMGGLTGELAGRFANNFSPSSPNLRTFAEILGGTLGGGLTGLVTAPTLNNAQTAIRRAATGTTAEDFAQANKNAAQVREAGINTGTAAEMFPPNSGLVSLGRQVREGTPDNQMRTQTVNRPQEIQDLGQTFLKRILGGDVSPNTVANSAGEAATGAETTLKALRGESLGNRLEGQILQPQQTINIENNLKMLGGTPGNRPEVRAAFEEVASRLRDADGKPLRSVQQLSLAIKGLKAAAKNPLVQTATGASIAGNDLKQAIGAAEKMLGDVNPAFEQGMQEFKDFSQGPMAAQTRGPIGSLAFSNPLREKQIPASRLESFVGGNSPDQITGTMRVLSNPVLTGGPTANPLEIAKAIASQRLAKGPESPGQAIRGTEGSIAQRQFEGLLKAGGNDVGNTMSPLSVADRLENFAKPPGIHELPDAGLSPRILRMMDMWLSGKKEAAKSAELGRLLSDSSPEGIRKLQELAMFNPQIRQMLSAKAAAMPLLNQENQ